MKSVRYRGLKIILLITKVAPLAGLNGVTVRAFKMELITYPFIILDTVRSVIDLLSFLFCWTTLSFVL